MDVGTAFRRLFHIISPVFLAYYLIPESLGGGITRTALLILFLGTAACIEVARIALGVPLLGMRPYEGQRVSAYAQGAAGLAVGLLIVRDPAIVVPVFLGMAWIDPLAAFARTQGWPRAVAVAAYFALFFTTGYVLFGAQNSTWQFLAAVLATTTAMLVEGPKHSQLDDDLLMLVVPMAVLAAASALLRPSFLP